MCVFQTKEKGKGKESMLLHRKAFTTKHAGVLQRFYSRFFKKCGVKCQ